MLSIIIPSRNERYLAQTVDDLRANAHGKIEIVVALDGKTSHSHGNPDLVIEKPSSQGIRPCINEAVAASHGDYLLKMDAHCIIGDGFDEILQKDCEDDWVVVARRYTLDLATMTKIPRIVDYYYLSCPWTYPRGTMMMQSCPWISRTDERMDIPIDDLMCFQGSMWFMSRKHWDWLGGLATDMTFAEHHEISMKTWLGGGRVVINKNIWYAHPRETTHSYHMSMSTVHYDHDRSAHYWVENKWDERIHDFDWLIDKFWPLPTENSRHKLEKYYWPDEWRNK